MKYAVLLLVIFQFFFVRSSAQDTYVERDDPYGYNEWTDFMWCVRAGVGVQNALYGEVGISRLRYTFKDVGQFSQAYYASMEWTPTILPDKPRNIYGFKAGYEINLYALALGLEAKYLSDFEKDSWVATPRIGLGMMGIFNLFYGYNIWLNTNPFDEIGHHQLSIILNLNRYLIKGDRDKPK